jgi:ribonuclease Z
MKKFLLFLAALALVSVTTLGLFGEKLLTRAVQRIATDNMSGKTLKDLPDGLHIFLCGAGSPMPDKKRSGPCSIVIAGEQVLVVDSGSGSVKNFGLMGIPAGQVDALLLTHFHSDHIDGVGELGTIRWAGGHHDQPLPVHGPAGVEKVIAGFNAAYSQDFIYRVEHHGAETVQPSGAGLAAKPFKRPKNGEAVTVLERGQLKVTAFSVTHDPIDPAVGYRFDYKGRSLVISGDTAYSDNLVTFSQGVDVLIHEALNREMVNLLEQTAERLQIAHVKKIMFDILNYHSSPVEAAEIAQQVGAKQLLLNHIVPPLPAKPLEWMFVKGVRDAYDGPVTIGQDGSFISLPAHSDIITSGNQL